MLDLTAVIAVKDRPENIMFCLASLSSGVAVPHCVVVDFGSAAPVKTETAVPWLTIIRTTHNTTRFHKARALNIGLKTVKTKYVVFTDADQIHSEGFFKVVYDTLDKANDSLVRCYTHYLPYLPSGMHPTNVRKNYGSLLKLAKEKDDRFLGEGCCLGCLTSNAIRIGGFDEDFIGWGYEDVAFSLRMLSMGCKDIYIHDRTSLVHLPHPQNLAGHVENKRLLDQKKAAKVAVANSGKIWGDL